MNRNGEAGEVAKLDTMRQQGQVIRAFLAWLLEQDIMLATWDMEGRCCCPDRLCRLPYTDTTLLTQYFGGDYEHMCQAEGELA